MKCYLVDQDADGQIRRGIADVPTDDLPPGDVLIRVKYSSLNYKDALAATGHPGVVKRFPHVPGIDAAGEVATIRDPRFHMGDQVLVTGYGMGAEAWGGYAEEVRVPADWVVRLPDGLTPREAMVYGTAGFTAAQSLDAIIRHPVAVEDGPVLVTGASGGVGSLAVGLLAHAGYEVVASTGKPAAGELLTALGAKQIIGRDDVLNDSDRPLAKARWAAAVDTVGGNTLASVLRATLRGGCVTACGLVGGTDLPISVYPFILRGISLVGIDSAECPMAARQQIWNKLAGKWKLNGLSRVAQVVGWEELDHKIDEILAGKVIGRTVLEIK